MRRKIAAGNWKMNKTPSEAIELAKMLKDKVAGARAEVIFCVPAIDIIPVSEVIKGSGIGLGAQNMYFEDSGAYTGEISASMLKDAGVKYVIIGHSERRQIFGESDETVNKKVSKALEYGLIPIMCCGETLEEREKGETKAKISAQVENGLSGIAKEEIKNIIIAYEPIWAIGTGKTATKEQAEEICEEIRHLIDKKYGAEAAENVHILYGGSVNGKNASELFAMDNIDGGLVGGASLKEEFEQIANYK